MSVDQQPFSLPILNLNPNTTSSTQTYTHRKRCLNSENENTPTYQPPRKALKTLKSLKTSKTIPWVQKRSIFKSMFFFCKKKLL